MSLTALSLVKNGYFPRELPPPFSPRKFAALTERDRDALPKKAVKTQCVRHNLAGPSGMRRPLGVPNPRSFLLLAEEFERQWPAIHDHLYGLPFSMSRPEIPEEPERAVRPRFRIGEHHRLRPRDWRGQRYVLKTDVSRFYPSLYTHSIPWALEGKQKAKSNIGNTDSDRLDKALRDTSDGQTMGVPIGPDTSFLAAEIVLTAVDKSLSSKIEMRGHRYIDDYELAFPTRGQAEEALAMLEESLSEYELTINFDKTEILELPQPFHLGWIHDLATFRIRTGRASQTITDLIALFSRAASISQSRRGPLKYALQRCRSVEIEDDEVWIAFQNLVLSSVSAEPTTIPVALDLLAVKSAASEFEVDREAAGEIINSAGKNMSPANIEAKLKASSPLIGQVCAIGDDRPYNVALIVLDPDFAPVFAQQHGIEDTSPEALATAPAILEEVAAGVERGNAGLSRVEQVKKFKLLPTDWQPGGDELTPTMKLKRRPIAHKYEAEIEALYSE